MTRAAPNKGLELTAANVRSCLAAASGPLSSNFSASLRKVPRACAQQRRCHVS